MRPWGMSWSSSSARLPLYHAIHVDPEEAGWLAAPRRKPRLFFLLCAIGLFLLLGLAYRLGEHTAAAATTIIQLSSLPADSPTPPLYDIRYNLSDCLSLSTPTGDAARQSTRWSPVAISTCDSNTAKYYAPCLVERVQGAVYGEELVYPDFRLREPVFASTREEEDASTWRGLADGIKERGVACRDAGWICYRGQHGQNIVLANATYTGSPPWDSWSDKACMNDGVSIDGFATAPSNASTNQLATQEEYDAAFPAETLLIATSPDSWSFQHFLDRVTHIITQGEHLMGGQSNRQIVSGAAPKDKIAELWKMLGWEHGRIHGGQQTAAKTVVFSCRAPLVHPWLSLRTLEAFGLMSTTVPLAERKKVVYCSRSHGNTANGGRRVRNEKALLADITALLEERGEGEELVLFNEDNFSSQAELMTWFHDNVRGVIGPHGGALFHHRWTGADTLVLEMMAPTFTSLMFWEEASILNQVYATAMSAPAGGTDMSADIPAVLEILRQQLGKPHPQGPSIKEAYRWSAPELQLPR